MQDSYEKLVGLPKFGTDGEELTYRISEEEVSDYSAVYAGDDTEELQEFDIKNVHTPGKVSRTVDKIWKNEDNKDNIRPDSITVQMYGSVDGIRNAIGNAVILNEGNNWSYRWDDLFANENGKQIIYLVEKMNVPDKYEIQETGTKLLLPILIRRRILRTPPTTRREAAEAAEAAHLHSHVRPSILRKCRWPIS